MKRYPVDKPLKIESTAQGLPPVQVALTCMRINWLKSRRGGAVTLPNPLPNTPFMSTLHTRTWKTHLKGRGNKRNPGRYERSITKGGRKTRGRG